MTGLEYNAGRAALKKQAKRWGLDTSEYNFNDPESMNELSEDVQDRRDAATNRNTRDTRAAADGLSGLGDRSRAESWWDGIVSGIKSIGQSIWQGITDMGESFGNLFAGNGFITNNELLETQIALQSQSMFAEMGLEEPVLESEVIKTSDGMKTKNKGAIGHIAQEELVPPVVADLQQSRSETSISKMEEITYGSTPQDEIDLDSMVDNGSSIDQDLTVEATDIISDFYKDTKATTEQRINDLKAQGYNTTGLEKQVQQMRANLKKNQPVQPATEKVAAPKNMTIADYAQHSIETSTPFSLGKKFMRLFGGGDRQARLDSLASYNGYQLPVSQDDYARGNGIRQQYSDRHQGVDISLYENTPIIAEDNGVVTLSQWQDSVDYSVGYGQYMLVDYGNGVKKLYGHLNQRNYKAGERVPAGSILGLSGNSGLSDGPHLHYEIRRNGQRVNPFSQWWR